MLFLYDAIITTGEDVRCFWGRKVAGAAILFWLNKYVTSLPLVGLSAHWCAARSSVFKNAPKVSQKAAGSGQKSVLDMIEEKEDAARRKGKQVAGSR